MSKQGIKDVAKIFSDMQELRIKLLGSDNQDIMLSAMLEDMKETAKDDFAKITNQIIEE
jgi:hypothetical protein